MIGFMKAGHRMGSGSIYKLEHEEKCSGPRSAHKKKKKVTLYALSVRTGLANNVNVLAICYCDLKI